MFGGVNAYGTYEVRQAQSEGLDLSGEQRHFSIFLSNHGILRRAVGPLNRRAI